LLLSCITCDKGIQLSQHLSKTGVDKPNQVHVYLPLVPSWHLIFDLTDARVARTEEAQLNPRPSHEAEFDLLQTAVAPLLWLAVGNQRDGCRIGYGPFVARHQSAITRSCRNLILHCFDVVGGFRKGKDDPSGAAS
jgi:hypothetical protein